MNGPVPVQTVMTKFTIHTYCGNAPDIVVPGPEQRFRPGEVEDEGAFNGVISTEQGVAISWWIRGAVL